MSALQTARRRTFRQIKCASRPVAADAKGFKGGLAMCITADTSQGYYNQGDGTLTGVVVGTFLEDFDNTGGDDGDITAGIEFSRERFVEVLDNDDNGTPVDETYREQQCYVLDDHTVTADVGTVAAGIVYDVVDGKVWVEINAEPATAELAPGISATAPVDPSSTAASAGAATLAAAQDHKHHIALATPAAEGLMSASCASAVHAAVADMAALKAIAAAARANGMLCMVLSDTAAEVSLWRFHSTSTASDTSENLVATPAVGSGRWLRADKTVPLFLSVTHSNTDNSTIFTVPTGARLHPREAWWEVTTNWTGGSSPAIGVHASPTGWTTKGDILGGASGDVGATLVTTSTRMTGTIGAKLDTRTNGRLIMVAADTFKFDRITDVFSAGAANVRILCDVLSNLGA